MEFGNPGNISTISKQGVRTPSIIVVYQRVTYKRAKIGDGSLCPIIGYETIKLKVQTNRGMRVITLRNQACGLECAANIIGQDDLVGQGFTFVRGSKLMFVGRDSDSLRIMMTQKRGLTFWSGVPLN
jgi:hypothetical protein